MATVDYTRGSGSGGLAGPSAYNRVFVVEKKIDLTETARASGDLMEIFNVKAGMIILGGWLNVTTAETVASAAITIGDASDPDGWLTSTVTTSTGFTVFDGALIGAESVGYMYAADDTIDITCSAHVHAVGIYNVGIFGIDTSDRPNLGTNA